MPRPPAGVTESEVLGQPRVWADVLTVLGDRLPAIADTWRADRPREVLLTGCGSSYYVASAAACLLQSILCLPCRAAPASEVVFFGQGQYLSARPPLLIGISRSGETTETLWAVRRLKQDGASTLALTCREGGRLAQVTDWSLVLPVDERSIVMTSSFTSMLLALAALAAYLESGTGTLDRIQGVPASGAQYLRSMSRHARRVAETGGGFHVYLGLGPLYGIAAEGALKMTEMALVPACVYHTLEYLHGPKAAAAPDVRVIGLLSGTAPAQESQVLRQAAKLGASVVAVGGEVEGLECVLFDVEPGSVPALLLSSVWLQLLALHTARVRGINPDTPRSLQHTVTWNGPVGQGGEA